MVTETGFTPMEAIQSATRVGADTIYMGDEVGRLAPGYYADVLVIDGDPLADISILQRHERLERVYKGGELVAGSVRRRSPELEFPSAVVAEPQIAGGAHVHDDEDSGPSCLQHSSELDNG